HPLANNKGEISKDRIADETFLIREKGSGTRTSLEIYLGEIPGRLDALGIEMDSIETIKQSVMAGMGIGVISAHTIAQEVETGRMVILNVEGMPIKRQWFSVTRSGMAISPAMASFQQFLQSNATRYFPHFPGR
ncbi:MAG: LysR family transcriptional regulator, partial [Hyphomicrobiales bacterium]|nr:LysR family transcriptional regulator [Hyphomicrobiales bacterium]